MERLYENLVGQSKAVRMSDMITLPGGRLADSLSGSQLETSQIRRLFGPFSARLVSVSRGVEQLSSQDITVIGGWCAIRTADMLLIKSGVIIDPNTGQITRYKSTDEVCNWIETSPTIDQVIEAIGMYTGDAYVAISEEQLWGDRIKSAITNQLGRSLLPAEIISIEDSLTRAELKRYEMTRRYIAFVTGKMPNFTRFTDRDIYLDLLDVQKQMFKAAGITLDQLIQMFPEEKGIDSYSLVWGMYTGPYFALLQQKGIANTPKGLIIEPWWHAIGETRAKNFMNIRTFEEPNNYFRKNGVNENLGFAAYANLMNPDGTQMWVATPLNKIPNLSNYPGFIREIFTQEACCNLDLSQNPAFIWGVNLLPFGVCKKALLEMLQIKDEYKNLKKKLPDTTRETRTQMVNKLKEEFRAQILIQAFIIQRELEKMLKVVFG